MANTQVFSTSGPPSTQQEFRQAFIEGQAGISRPTIEEVALGSGSPSAQSGIVAAAGRITAPERPVVITSATTPPTLTPALVGQVAICTKSSGNQTFTLPPAQTYGLPYTFVCANAGGEILVNPVGTDTISIKASEGGASVITAAGVGIKNTAATNVVGDHVTLISDGVSQWVMIAQSGTWASQ